jgi:hypothetical protein
MLLGELKTAEPALNKIMAAELPVNLAYRYHKIMQKIGEENAPIEETRVELIKKYGEKQPDGSFQVIPANIDAFTEEFKILMDTDINVDMGEYQVASIGELDRAGVKLSVSDVSLLLRIEVIKEK